VERDLLEQSPTFAEGFAGQVATLKVQEIEDVVCEVVRSPMVEGLERRAAVRVHRDQLTVQIALRMGIDLMARAIEAYWRVASCMLRE
jgi:hypothetical protein